MNTDEQPNPTEWQATITLGINAPAKWFYVARQVDGAMEAHSGRSPRLGRGAAPDTGTPHEPMEAEEKVMTQVIQAATPPPGRKRRGTIIGQAI